MTKKQKPPTPEQRAEARRRVEEARAEIAARTCSKGTLQARRVARRGRSIHRKMGAP